MRFILSLVALLAVAVSCQAQISVSDQLPPPVKYPAEVYKMTDAEFYNWAVKFNQAQIDDWKKRKAEIKEPEYLTGTEKVTVTEYSGLSGPSYGYGCGGYGGYGGYGGGYFARSPYGSGGCGPRFGYGDYGYGDSFGGSSVRRTGEYPWRRPNPDYVGPGPLVIVNPYVKPTK